MPLPHITELGRYAVEELQGQKIDFRCDWPYGVGTIEIEESKRGFQISICLPDEKITIDQTTWNHLEKVDHPDYAFRINRVV